MVEAMTPDQLAEIKARWLIKSTPLTENDRDMADLLDEITRLRKIEDAKPMTDKNVEAVTRRLRQRSVKGVHTYGVTTDKAGLSPVEWLRHLQDELLDGAVYIQAFLNETEDTKG